MRSSIQPILAHIGEPPEAPPIAPASALRGSATDAEPHLAWEIGVEPTPDIEFDQRENWCKCCRSYAAIVPLWWRCGAAAVMAPRSKREKSAAQQERKKRRAAREKRAPRIATRSAEENV